MALDRDFLKRNQSLSNNSLKYPKTNRELKVEYSSVKQEAKIADKTDTQIRTQPIGLIYCAPKLKKVVKVIWTLTLLAYVVVLPVLIMILFKDYSNSLVRIEKLKEKWQLHIDQEEKVKKKDDEKEKTRQKRGASIPMSEAFKKHRKCSEDLAKMDIKVKNLKKLLELHESR